jgi:hypothetical protein
VADSQANTEDPDTARQFEQFAELARRLLAVPKSEVDEKLASEKEVAAKRKTERDKSQR